MEQEPTSNTGTVELRLLELEKRILALESAGTQSNTTNLPTSVTKDDSFWALNHLIELQPNDHATSAGSVMIVGNVDLPTGGTAAWQETAGSAGLLDTDWALSAHNLAALGHPARLNLLRHILNGAHTTAELSEALDEASSGQLHHHLRQLVATGWARQTGRGRYEIPAQRIIPLLSCVMGGQA